MLNRAAITASTRSSTVATVFIPEPTGYQEQRPNDNQRHQKYQSDEAEPPGRRRPSQDEYRHGGDEHVGTQEQR